MEKTGEDFGGNSGYKSARMVKGMAIFARSPKTLKFWKGEKGEQRKLLPPSTESVGEIIYMGVKREVQPMLVGSTLSITELDFTYRQATFRAAYFYKVYLQNHLVSIYLWVGHLNWRLSL